MHAIIALSASGLIEKYGAYAGIAAIPGLAVLSLLYFAQAREVRRLREWAGRAPERELERPTSGVHVAPTGARDPVSVVRRQPPPSASRPGAPAAPGARPAPATPGGAKPASPAGAPASPGARPGPAVPAAATAAATAAAPSGPSAKPAGAPSDKPGEEPAKPAAPAAKPSAPASKPAEAKPAATAAPSPSGSPDANGPGDPAAAERAAARPAAPAAATAAGASGARASAAAPAASPRPSEGAPPARPATPGASASRAAPLRADRPRATAPSRGGRDPLPPRRPSTGRPRRAAYIAVAAVLLIVLVVVIVAATSGGGSEKKAPNTISPAQQAAPGKAKRPKPAPVPRGEIKVAVLNGTTQAGLAAQVGDQVTASGFKKGQVTNAPDQQAQQTVVYYASGQKKAAQEVAKVVKAGSVQAIDPDTQAVAGSDAKVVVLVGADKT